MLPKVPSYHELMNPLLRALRSLGGSGTINEIDGKVVELEKFPDEILELPHDPEKSTQTQIEYRLAWARSYLKKYGMLENSSRGVWALTSMAKGKDSVDPKIVVRAVRAMIKNEREEAGVTEAV